MLLLLDEILWAIEVLKKLNNHDNWLKMSNKTKRVGGNALHGSYILSKKARAIRM